MARLLKRGKKGLDVKQLQIDLNKLGYYDAKSDIYFGAITDSAVRMFQSDSDIMVDGKVGKYTYRVLYDALYGDEPIPDDEEIKTEHFNLSEFISPADKDAVKYGLSDEVKENLLDLMRRLEKIRSAIGDKGIIIRSGYRSPTYNKSVGGASRSQHMFGRACDMYIENREISCCSLAKLLWANVSFKALFGGYGLGSVTNLHLDTRYKANVLRPSYWWYMYKTWARWERAS